MVYSRIVVQAQKTEMAVAKTEMVGAQPQTGGCCRDVHSIRGVALLLK